MAFNSFCGLLTLQVGCAIMSSVFFIIAALTFGLNVFDYTKHADNSWPIDLLFMCIFVALTFMAGTLIFFAAYRESRRLCLAALVVIVLLMLFWLTLTIISFINQPTYVRRVCVEHRCAATFWLASLNYRAQSDRTYGYTTIDMSRTVAKTEITHRPYEDVTTTDKPVTTTTVGTTSENTLPQTHSYTSPSTTDSTSQSTFEESTVSMIDVTSEKTTTDSVHRRKKRVLSNLESEGSSDMENDYKEEEDDSHSSEEANGNSENTPNETGEVFDAETSDYVYGSAFVGSIIFALINFLFFVSAIIIVWSYAQELKWDSHYNNSQTQ